jgi:predicted DNA-binding transcriptional regulator AlpA
MAFTRDPNVINVSPTVESLSDVMPDDGLLTLHQVMALTQLSQPTVYRLMRQGKFIKPIAVGGSVRWLRSELVDYLMQRVLERNERQQALAQKNAASL